MQASKQETPVEANYERTIQILGKTFHVDLDSKLLVVSVKIDGVPDDDHYCHTMAEAIWTFNVVVGTYSSVERTLSK